MQKKAKILLIDDDEDFVESTKIALESKNYDVIVAHNGNDGFNMAKSQIPDLILLDVIMPGKDGFSTAELLKKDNDLKKIPLFMLTSFAQRGGGTGIPRSRGMELEADDYIDKAITPDELLAKVKNNLTQKGL